MINKSLLTLGTVINKLSEGVHVQGTRVTGVPVTHHMAASSAVCSSAATWCLMHMT